MEKADSRAGWLVVLGVSFTVLALVLTSDDGERLSILLPSKALIYAYALSAAYLLYQEFIEPVRRAALSSESGHGAD